MYSNSFLSVTALGFKPKTLRRDGILYSVAVMRFFLKLKKELDILTPFYQ